MLKTLSHAIFSFRILMWHEIEAIRHDLMELAGTKHDVARQRLEVARREDHYGAAELFDQAYTLLFNAEANVDMARRLDTDCRRSEAWSFRSKAKRQIDKASVLMDQGENLTTTSH